MFCWLLLCWNWDFFPSRLPSSFSFECTTDSLPLCDKWQENEERDREIRVKRRFEVGDRSWDTWLTCATWQGAAAIPRLSGKCWHSHTHKSQGLVNPILCFVRRSDDCLPSIYAYDFPSECFSLRIPVKMSRVSLPFVSGGRKLLHLLFESSFPPSIPCLVFYYYDFLYSCSFSAWVTSLSLSPPHSLLLINHLNIWWACTAINLTDWVAATKIKKFKSLSTPLPPPAASADPGNTKMWNRKRIWPRMNLHISLPSQIFQHSLSTPHVHLFWLLQPFLLTKSLCLRLHRYHSIPPSEHFHDRVCEEILKTREVSGTSRRPIRRCVLVNRLPT